VPGCGLPACGDALDNDGDGRTDHPSDPGCSSASDTSEKGAIVCDDGLDNDGDSYVDYPSDRGCRFPDSTSEKTQCQDGLNNDNKAGIDFDGGRSLDLDHNGFVDAPFNPATPAVGTADPQCTAAWINKEKSGSCGLGFELVAVLGLLALRDPRRATRSSN
jgi:hypothetical protein